MFEQYSNEFSILINLGIGAWEQYFNELRYC